MRRTAWSVARRRVRRIGFSNSFVTCNFNLNFTFLMLQVTCYKLQVTSYKLLLNCYPLHPLSRHTPRRPPPFRPYSARASRSVRHCRTCAARHENGVGASARSCRMHFVRGALRVSKIVQRRLRASPRTHPLGRGFRADHRCARECHCLLLCQLAVGAVGLSTAPTPLPHARLHAFPPTRRPVRNG